MLLSLDVMNNEPIERQIEGLGDRRLLGRAVATALVVAAGGVAYRLVVGHSEDAPTRAAAALAVSGLLFGFATSSLAAKMRRLLTVALVVLPLAVSVCLFALRTVLGWSAELPMRLVAAPVCLSAGFVIGHFTRPAHLRMKKEG